MRNLWRLFILGAMAAALPASAMAQSIGLNFAADDPSAEVSALDPTDVAGAYAAANWNNLNGAMGSSTSGLVLDDGTASSVSVSWTSNNTWRSTDTGNNGFPEGGDRTLMAGYLDYLDDPVTPISITVDNVDAALEDPTYDLYVYFLGDSGDDRGGAYTFDNGTDQVVMYGSTLAEPSGHVLDPGTDMDNSLDGTYLKFTGLSGSSFTLTADAALTDPAGFRSPINGLQIVAQTEPGDVNGDGNVDVDDFNIIRSNFFNAGMTYAEGNITGGLVDFEDYRLWKANAPAAVVASVEGLLIPEPTTGVLMAMGGALAAFTRRRAKGRVVGSAA